MKQLYQRAFENISKVLNEGHKAVIGLSNKDGIKWGKKYLTLLKIYEFKVHRSLTRYFTVFEK